MNKKEKEELEAKLKKVNEKFEKFWAEMVIEDDVMIGASLNIGELGIMPTINFFPASDKAREKARKVLEDGNKVIIAQADTRKVIDALKKGS